MPDFCLKGEINVSVKLGAKTFLYPMPAVLVGANVHGRPNYCTVAFCGIVQYDPPMVAVGISKKHHTTSGIRASQTFSVSIPSADMVAVTDYCGLVSGHKADKSSLFRNFYGELETAPMIEECPLAIECRVVREIDDLGVDVIFIGEIVEVYAREECLTNGEPDIKKINPLIFSSPDNNYWKVGEHLAKAWSVGKDFKP